MTLLAAGHSAASSAAPGALGFLVVAGLGLAVFFLFRSMTKHLRKVRVAAEESAAAPPAKAGSGASARVSTGAAATDKAANKETGPQGS